MLRILILCCLFIGYSLSAGTKVAIIDSGPLGNVILPAMSEHDEFDLFERSQIASLLKEHKLSNRGLIMAAITKKFPHIELFIFIDKTETDHNTAPSRAVIFNARNGFRLANIKLDPNIERASSLVVDATRQAVECMNSTSANYLAITAIRDIGVPDRLKLNMAGFAIQLQNQLNQLQNVQILERDYLDPVVQERSLTEKIYKLVPSARLIRLEFVPGSSAEIVNLTLRITDSSGKILFSCDLPDCLKNSSVSVIALTEKISKFLNSPVKTNTSPVDPKTEAAGFYREYLLLLKTDGKRSLDKISAAVALDPDNIDYQKERLKALFYNYHFDSEFIPYGSPNFRKRQKQQRHKYMIHRFKHFEYIVDEYFSIRKKFPDNDRLGSCISYLRTKLFANRQYSDEFQKKCKQLFDRIIPEIVRSVNTYYTSNGWKPFTEVQNDEQLKLLQQYREYIKYYHWNYIPLMDQFMTLSEIEMRYMVIHNQSCHTISTIHKYDKTMMRNLSFTMSYGTPDKLKTTEYFIRKSERLTEIAARFPSQKIDMLFELLTIYRNAYEYPEKKAVWQKQFADWQLKGRRPPYIRPCHYWSTEARPPCLRKSPKKQQKSTASKPKAVKPVNIKSLTNPEDINKAIEKAYNEKRTQAVIDLCQKIGGIENVSDRYIKSWLYERSRHWLEIYSMKRQQKDIDNVRALYPDFFITELKKPDDMKHFNIQSSVLVGNKLYLLNSINKKVLEYDLNGNYRTLFHLKYSSDYIFYDNDKLIFDYFEYYPKAFAQIIVYDLKNNKLTEITDLPIKKIRKMVLWKERIYAWDIGTLFSCKYDGSDRKIELSTRRETPRNELERNPGMSVYQLDGCSAGIIMYVISRNQNQRRKNGYWLFNPATGSTRKLKSSYPPLHLINSPFGKMFYDNRKIYYYDETFKKPKKYFFSYKVKDNSKYFASKLEYVTYPLIIQKDRIWNARYLLEYIGDEFKARHIPVYFRGNNSRMYSHPDGKSMIRVTENAIFIYSLKPSK